MNTIMKVVGGTPLLFVEMFPVASHEFLPCF